MASFEHLPSGAWRVKVRRAGLKPLSATFDTKNKARVWATNIEAAADTGALQNQALADNLTLSQALDKYAAEITPMKRGARQELARVRRWQREPIASKPLGQVMPAHLAAYRDRRRTEGISPTTIRTDLALVSHLYKIAGKEWSLPVRNPVRDIQLPEAAPGRTRRLVGDEEVQLLAACRSEPGGNGKSVTTTPWLEPAVRLALETGMRLGEIVALRWEHMDFRRRTAFLPDTKNGTVRSVPLSARAIVTLLAVPSAWEDRVIPTTTAAIHQAWRHAVRRARIEGLRFHDLRHEFTSRLFERSDLRDLEIQGITGHLTGAMLRRYAHLRASDLAARLDNRHF